MKRRRITQAEWDRFAELYPTTSTAEIARELDRTITSIYGMATKMGLYKTDEYIAAKRAREAKLLAEAGKAHHYPKGHVPANKGLRRPGYSPGNMAKTQFKKGSFSPNRREIGDERISKDGYIYVKVADGQKNSNWKQKHWIVWEAANGPIPPGANVVFRDGNKQNVDLSNLQMISDAELMSLNTFHNYPEPVKQQIHILAGFRRRLNSYAKKQDRGSQEHPV